MSPIDTDNQFADQSDLRNLEAEKRPRKTKSPQQKKALAYEKDRYVIVEYPKRFRKNWPHKKARSQRKYRRQIRQLLVAVRSPKIAEDEIVDLMLKPIRRDVVRKRHPRFGITLREIIEIRTRQRAEILLASFFKEPYQSTSHREAFSHFLELITLKYDIQAQQVAEILNPLLDSRIPKPQHYRLIRHKPQWLAEWLSQFLSDEPEWGARLRTWITEFDQLLRLSRKSR